MPQEPMAALIVAANTAAQAGDWQTACEKMAQAAKIQPQEIGILSGYATCLLQTRQAEEAITIFKQITTLAPKSAEPVNNLGVAHNLTGNTAAAEAAYKAALEIDSEYTPAWKNLAQLYIQQPDRVAEGVQILAALVKSNPNDNEALVLMASCYEIGGDYSSAETLLRRALENQPGFPQAQTALDRIAKQTDLSRIARPEHAQKLAALKGLKGPTSNHQPKPAVVYDRLAQTSIAFYASPELSGMAQFQIWAKTLDQKGFQTRVSDSFEAGDLEKYEYFVFSNPNISPALINAVTTCMQAGKKFTIDLDMDFHHMPEDHPAYGHFGPGNPRALQALEIMMKDAEWVSVPSSVMVERCRPFAKRIELVPPQVDFSNPQWSKPQPKRETYQVGWIGSSAERGDILTIKEELSQFVLDHPKVTLVIAGDSGAYEAFDSIPETRRLFLPNSGWEDIPYTLGQFDLLVVPLRVNAFNTARSNLILLEADAKKVPWIAAPIPSFKETSAGGRLASTPAEWAQALIEASLR